MTRTITLRPDTGISLTPNASTTWAVTGAASRTAAVSDSSGSSYIEGLVGPLGDASQEIVFGLDTVALSGVVTAARIGFTHSFAGAAGRTGTMTLTTSGGTQIATLTKNATDIADTPANDEYAFTLDAPYAGFLSQTVVDGMRLVLLATHPGGGGAGLWTVYEVYVELDVEDQPPGIIPVGF